MPTLKLFEIFRAGLHTAINGMAREYTANELDYMAAAYSPDRRIAPLVLGHPTNQNAAQSFGEVSQLTVKAGKLYALARVTDRLIELVRAGYYRKVSASFATPYSPDNPVPDAFYLRHIGFLGAQPPGVKGLADPSFSEGRGAVSFASEITEFIAEREPFVVPAGYRVGDAHRLATHHSAIQMQRACPSLSYCEAVGMAEGVKLF